MTGAPPNAHATWNADGSLTIRTTYDADLIAEWKDLVPPSFRSFDPGTKAWTFHGEYTADALAATRSYIGHVTVDDLRASRQQAGGQQWAEALFQALPAPLHSSAYRALVRVVHPDVGGSDRLAQQLNDAFHGAHR